MALVGYGGVGKEGKKYYTLTHDRVLMCIFLSSETDVCYENRGFRTLFGNLRFRIAKKVFFVGFLEKGNKNMVK